MTFRDQEVQSCRNSAISKKILGSTDMHVPAHNTPREHMHLLRVSVSSRDTEGMKPARPLFPVSPAHSVTATEI